MKGKDRIIAELRVKKARERIIKAVLEYTDPGPIKPGGIGRGISLSGGDSGLFILQLQRDAYELREALAAEAKAKQMRTDIETAKMVAGAVKEKHGDAVGVRRKGSTVTLTAPKAKRKRG